jgi:pimeloyl-ACP methyl ester carboxylesterase
MGGYVALAFANQHPSRVSGLGLVSSQVLADPPERKEGRYKTADDVAEKGIQGVVEAMTPKFTADKQIQETAAEVMARQQPAAYIGALKAMAERVDASKLLAAFNFPVVVIHGDADDLIPVARSREIKESIPHAHLLELKGVGHLPMMETPKETAKALLQFA